MIIESLIEYHQQQVAIGSSCCAPCAMELKMIHYVVVLTLDGVIVEIEKPIKKQFVAKSRARSGKDAALIANRLWDHTGYVFGYSAENAGEDAALVRHRSFVNLVKEIAEANPNNGELAAVVKFYERGVELLKNHPLWSEITSKAGLNISFRIEGEEQLLAQHPDVIEHETQTKVGQCIVTGKRSPLIHTHPKVRIYGGTPVGAKLVSFNKESGYDSYRLRGTQNAPMSVGVAESYASALNGLLQFEGRNKIIVGTITFVFYTLPNSDLDTHFSILMGDTEGNRRQTLEMLRENRDRYATNEMVVMAFAPNVARISVRMGVRINAAQFIDNILKFYEETQLGHNYNAADAMTILMPLFSIAFQSDVATLPPQLIVDYVEAVLLNKRLPAIFQQELLKTVREHTTGDLTAHSMIRCYMVRNTGVSDEQIASSKGYNLGAMLLVMDRAKWLSGGNSTTRKIPYVYCKILSINPSLVFDRLVELTYIFIRQIRSQELQLSLQQRVEELVEINRANGIPLILSPDEQCCFALGHFLGRQNYFKKR